MLHAKVASLVPRSLPAGAALLNKYQEVQDERNSDAAYVIIILAHRSPRYCCHAARRGMCVPSDVSLDVWCHRALSSYGMVGAARGGTYQGYEAAPGWHSNVSGLRYCFATVL